jgi:quercetin dioxygenase-like cupin family protein
MNLLRSIAPLALAATLPVLMPDTLSAAASAPKIGSTIFKWEELPVRTTPNGERRNVANNPSDTLVVFESHVTTLNPGRASHPPHRHAHEELIIVKEGTVEVNLNGETQVVGPGSAFFYASNDPHALRNVGDTRATYWVFTFATAATSDPAAHNPAPTLQSAVFDWKKLTVQPTATGLRRALLKGSTATMTSLSAHVTTVNAGKASHGAHRHPDEEIIVVKEGTLEVTINGESQHAGEGSIIFCASNDLHGMRNAGDTPATYYVIRMITDATPKPVAGL